MASPASSSSSCVLPAIKVVEQCRVCPLVDSLPPAVGGAVSLPLTFWDVCWISRQVERLYFYSWPGITTSYFAAAALPRLKRSLSLALGRYYTLAGRLRPPQSAPSPEESFHILCTAADSVPFTLAEVSDDMDQYPSFDQLSGDHPRGTEVFCPLVPALPPATPDGERGLIALQVTVFPGGGVCLAVSLLHAACDGSGFTSFVKAWASICRSLGNKEEETASLLSEPPVIDRAPVSDPRGLYGIFLDFLTQRYKAGDWNVTNESPMVISTFRLRRADIEVLRRQVLEQRVPEVPYSSFVLTCAYAWVCLFQATVERSPPPPELGDAAYLAFVVDCRRRVNPPLPSSYFGNCLGFCIVKVRREDLLSEQDAVGRVAESIACSVAALGNDGRILDGAEEWLPKLSSLFPARPLSISGSPRFGVYSTDFGWGRPLKVEMPGIAKTGAFSLAENRDGDGGVEVGLVLPQQEMAKFSTLFAAGLKDTS